MTAAVDSLADIAVRVTAGERISVDYMEEKGMMMAQAVKPAAKK
jgi:hypothetical protein